MPPMFAPTSLPVPGPEFRWHTVWTLNGEGHTDAKKTEVLTPLGGVPVTTVQEWMIEAPVEAAYMQPPPVGSASYRRYTPSPTPSAAVSIA